MRIALVGDQNLSFESHRELNAVGPLLGADVELAWVPTDGDEIEDLSGFAAVWLVPGSPYASDAAVYRLITRMRTDGRPFLGTCAGFQHAVIEYARTVLGQDDASHAEVDGTSPSNVVVPLACSLFGEVRAVRPIAGTRFAELVGGQPFEGTHFCDYGPDAAAIERMVGAGWSLEATAEDAGAEVLRLPGSDFFYLTLFQPQVGSLAGRAPHPLLREFVRCAQAA